MPSLQDLQNVVEDAVLKLGLRSRGAAPYACQLRARLLRRRMPSQFAAEFVQSVLAAPWRALFESLKDAVGVVARVAAGQRRRRWHRRHRLLRRRRFGDSDLEDSEDSEGTSVTPTAAWT